MKILQYIFQKCFRKLFSRVNGEPYHSCSFLKKFFIIFYKKMFLKLLIS
ncbi:hypothetical protein RIEPE_0471 [Candidatus Riesia pediculicola USDA]|uniref:Uncharacterized protein n=1 Tax=Riesia pediculicola (strain USDA) TaxID=515618 RepID=D4G8Q3_RIEPU|nr:hypothetical protein RIEPE_0471 [Candidatus Riesia pediculicola USDA]